jgi:hypothetical protein
MCEWIKTAKVGDKVVCVRDDIDGGYPNREKRPLEGIVYTIREICEGYPSDIDGRGIAIRLVEIVNPKIRYTEGLHEPAWSAHRFRPVTPRKTDISFAHDILRKATKPVTEDA